MSQGPNPYKPTYPDSGQSAIDLANRRREEPLFKSVLKILKEKPLNFFANVNVMDNINNRNDFLLPDLMRTPAPILFPNPKKIVQTKRPNPDTTWLNADRKNTHWASAQRGVAT